MGQRRVKRMLAVVLASLVVVAADESHAGRPLDTEDTGTLEPGRAELELSGDYADDIDGTLGAFNGVLGVGVLPRLEVRIESSYLLIDPDHEDAEDGVGDSLLGVKYRPLDETDTVPAVLIGATLRLPTGDETRGLGETGVDVGVLAAVSKTFGPATLTWNGGYTFVTEDRGLDAWLLAASLEYRLTKHWLVASEVVSEVGAGRQTDSAVFRGGAVYVITERVRLDGAIATGLTRGSPDLLIAVGVTISIR